MVYSSYVYYNKALEMDGEQDLTPAEQAQLDRIPAPPRPTLQTRIVVTFNALVAPLALLVLFVLCACTILGAIYVPVH